MTIGGDAIFIHGAGGGPWEWKVWLPAFRSAGWRCHAPDLQAGSEHLAELGFGDYLRRVQSVLESAESRSRVVLVGASLGGLLALASADSPRVAAVCLVNPVPPAGIPAWPAVAREVPDVMPWSRTATREGTRRSMPDATEAAVDEAMQRWRDESGAVLREVRSGISCPQPRQPLLIIYGTPDSEIPRAAVDALRADCGADLLVAEGSGHMGALLGRRASLWARLAETWLQCQTVP